MFYHFFLALGSCCAYLTTVNKSKRFGKTFFRLQVAWKSHFCSVSVLGRAGGALTLPTIQLASIPSAFLHAFPKMVSSNEYRNFPIFAVAQFDEPFENLIKGKSCCSTLRKIPFKRESREVAEMLAFISFFSGASWLHQRT